MRLKRTLEDLVARLLDWPTTLIGVLVSIMTWLLLQGQIEIEGYVAALGAFVSLGYMLTKRSGGNENNTGNYA